MTKLARITNAIFTAVDEVNEILPKHRRIDKSIDALLFDESGTLDSLAFVTLIVAIEQKIEDEYAVAINLADGDTLSQKDSPFKTVGKLVDHISLLVTAQN